MTDSRPTFDPARAASGSAGGAVSPEDRSWWPRAGLADRLVQMVLAVVAWGVLIMALHLQPSLDGLGTHEQLGFQPCGFYQMTGRPCPGCGMTTAFAYMAHGHPISAAIVQPCGAVLFLLTLAVAMCASVTVVAGRSWNLILLRIHTPVWLYTLVALGLASWIYKMAYGAMAGRYGL